MKGKKDSRKGSVHKSVLLNETIEGLNIALEKEAIVIDGTFGGGGHSGEILERYPHAKIIAFDNDKSVWGKNKAIDFLKSNSRITFHNENFRNIDKVIGLQKVDGVMFDLGLSSDQLENSGRGFSFMRDEPLLMTMKENPSSEDLTAQDVVNDWSEDSLQKIIRGYGEEKFAKKIARGIAMARENKKIQTTLELVEIIRESVPAFYRRGKIHFATRTFQALRMAVNDELGSLTDGLENGFERLKDGGRMVVISFHSLEDRIVKNFYKLKTKEEKAKIITKKPICASLEEVKMNPRSRSAKLRILEKTK